MWTSCGRLLVVLQFILCIMIIYASPHRKTAGQTAGQRILMGEHGKVDYVNTLMGTNNTWMNSHGNTLPYIGMPWGMNNWIVQTKAHIGEMWAFDVKDRYARGLRLTHIPSPWIGKYGDVLFSPSVGPSPSSGQRVHQRDLSLTNSAFTPYYFSGDFCDTFRSGSIPLLARAKPQASEIGSGCIRAELTTSGSISAVMRFTFPASTSAQPRTISIGGLNGVKSVGTADPGKGMVTGSIFGGPPNYHQYMVVETIPPLASPVTQSGLLDFGTSHEETVVTLRVSTSLISPEQAIRTLRTEIAAMSFTEVKRKGKAIWNQHLERVAIGDEVEETTRRIFYTNLYRATMFPRKAFELDGDGQPTHFSVYDNKVHPGPMSTDSGFWDAYRTVYSQLALLYPESLVEIINGWLNAFKENGAVPQWAAPGAKPMMVGTMSDVTLAEAIMKDLPGINQELAYEAIRCSAFDMTSGLKGRKELAFYISHGYVPSSVAESVSMTLNYAVADYAIAQAAKKLGKMQDYDILMQRSGNWKNLFDKGTGMFRPKMQSGDWKPRWDPYEWWMDYTEAGAWQYRFYVPHDVEGLKKAYEEAGMDICDKFKEMMTTSSAYKSRLAGGDRPEMLQMRDNCWGQYAHNNQPVHHVLYAWQTACPDSEAQHYIRRTIDEMYKLTEYPGDEDNGEMASWYLLSVMGLYPLEPGASTYVLGPPRFSSLTVRLPKSQSLVITAVNVSDANQYVQSATLNGKAVVDSKIEYRDLKDGGNLTVILGPTPPTV